MTTTTALSADQAATVEHARKALASEPPSMYELGDMAVRVGALEWHLGELLAIIDGTSELDRLLIPGTRSAQNRRPGAR